MSGKIYETDELLYDPRRPSDPPEQHRHKIWTISPDDVAAAQGFTIVCRTTSGAKRPGSIYPLEFVAEWEFHDVNGLRRSASILKPHNLFLVQPAQLVAQTGTQILPARWQGFLRDSLDALTWNCSGAQKEILSPPPPASSVPTVVRTLKPGDIIEIDGKPCAVVSNEHITHNHRFGSFLAIPLVAAGAASASSLAIRFSGQRLAFEQIQSCEPIDQVHSVTPTRDHLDHVALETAYVRLADLNLISPRDPASYKRTPKPDILAYLTATAQDLGTDGPAQLIPVRVTSAPPRPPMQIRRALRRRTAGETHEEPTFLLASHREQGPAGALRAEFWMQREVVKLRIVGEEGRPSSLSQVAVHSEAGEIALLDHDVPLPSWMWETELGRAGDLSDALLDINVVATGVVLGMSVKFTFLPA